ncbi:NAD-dependent epimerase/dehydratase family protein [Sporichthya polymorpha]|uniref:NAD-dependent epimerase/dehydratase family protein n=1 Tax=Sporichthya polymorpha TaxID=35751 RepID=UPI00035EAB79|nr:NAD-dependent epimerase/dehydratase family protein [Sporichthya polymorpha]
MSRFWTDRPTLVTGATGLVGGAVVRRLVDAGADVVCLVRDRVPNAELHRSGLDQHVASVAGDIRDQATIERILGEYEIDTVLHLAAQTLVPVANRNPVSTFESNIAGTWVVLEACRRSPLVRQIVLASSDKAYGSSDRLPYDEDTPLQGRHPYDVSKSCADLIAQSYAATYESPVAITRCGNFFGPGDLNWNRIVPGTIRSVLRGQRPVIRSDGKAVRDYFYVDEGAAAYLLLAERLAGDRALAGRAFNFSNEESYTVLDLVATLLRLMRSDLQPDVRGEASNEIAAQSLDASRARQELGWSPIYEFEESLRRTITWYEDLFASRGAL